MHFKLALLLLGALACVSALPASKDNRKKVQAKACEQCSDEVKIVCAKGDDGKLLAFGNECILRKSNCENNRNMKWNNDGYCEGSKNVRLS